jgi:hypothetical protein
VNRGEGCQQVCSECSGVSAANLVKGQEAIPIAKGPDSIIGWPVSYCELREHHTGITG